MINVDIATKLLNERYPGLEPVAEGVFRGVDNLKGRDYAIRYFDLNDQVEKTAKVIKSYQENLLADRYFSKSDPTDLRWNHYLYFVASEETAAGPDFRRSKSTIENDRDYARKQVLLESDLTRLLRTEVEVPNDDGLPLDLASVWTGRLEAVGLGFVLDELQIPEIVRRIAAGHKESSAGPLSSIEVLPAERAAARSFLNDIEIHGFRAHPFEKVFDLGVVNLIIGANGVGKTSLLEAIEYAYCGKNRRSSVVPSGTSVQATLVESGEKLSSTTSPMRLRARHSNWYAKAELKTVTIEDSFGKFNFLDTDAAVNLSVSSSSKQVGSDVARLVLGAEAEKLSDRIRRVYERLESDLEEVERNLRASELHLVAANGRLQDLEKTPKISDALLVDLQSSLLQVGWKLLPRSKEEVDATRTDILSAMSFAKTLQGVEADLLHVDSQGVQRFLADLDDLTQESIALSANLVTAESKAAEAISAKNSARATCVALDALLPYAKSDFERLTRSSDELQAEILRRSSRLASLSFPFASEGLEGLLSERIDEALRTARVGLAALRDNIQKARISLQSAEAVQSGLVVLRERLLSVARDVIHTTEDHSHCPVCRTEFVEAELLNRMSQITVDSSSRLASFHREVTELETQLRVAVLDERFLSALQSFVGDGVIEPTVSEVMDLVQEERVALDADLLADKIHRDKLAVLEENGLSTAELGIQLGAASLSAVPDTAALVLLIDEQKTLIDQARAAYAEADGKISALHRQRAALAIRVGLDVDTQASEIASHAQARQARFETGVSARQGISTFLAVSESMSIDEILSSLSLGQDLLVRMVTANAQEASANDALTKERKNVAETEERGEQYRRKVENLKPAKELLGELRRQSAEGEMADRILAENASEIGRIFASIHMPNEFEIDVRDGKLRIERRSSGEEVELAQMSTGQRAAYALSLFLAMNARLVSGPPILLFDDPVAHVDDINVLSFLDHLRSLATDGKRQIFFATADGKLAGLFRQKFRFLGESGFREICLKRE